MYSDKIMNLSINFYYSTRSNMILEDIYVIRSPYYELLTKLPSALVLRLPIQDNKKIARAQWVAY